MKKITKIYLLLSLISIIIVNNAQAFQQVEKEFPEVPQRTDITPEPSQRVAWDTFIAESPGWKVRWGNRSRVPASLVGPPKYVASGSPEQIARTFLQNHKKLLGMKEDLRDLTLHRVDQRRATHVTFQQNYKGVPIEGGIYSVNLTKDGKVYYASGDYFEDPSVMSFTPSITATNAIASAKNDLGSSIQGMSDTDPELLLLPYGSEFKLVWKVTINGKNVFGRWIYYISATDGTVLTGYNDVDVFASSSRATDNGDVYDHHPDAGPVVNRTLTHLSGAGNELDGSYVKVFNEDAAEISNGDFTYSASNAHFDEVMVYYHATEFQKFMGNEVGYSYLNYPNSLVQAHATVHYGTDYNGAGAANGYEMVFGDGDSVNYNDFAKEDVVIAHEYQHLITEYITYNGLNTWSWETAALDEAYSDYFAGNYAGTADIGVYVKILGQERDLENSYTWWDWKGDSPIFAYNDYHRASQIFSGALWDLRQELGTNIAIPLIFEGLDNLNEQGPKFLDAVDALIAADYAFYGGNNVPEILDVFQAREIVPSFSGTIAADTSWSSIIYLTADTEVDNNATLTIDPGTTVYLEDNVSLTIRPGAKLIAEGTEQEPIEFIRADPNNDWDRISLLSSSGNSIEWSLFDGGYINLSIASKNNTISHSTFRNATYRTLQGWHNQDGSGNASATISYSLIENSVTVGIVGQYIDLDISHTTIKSNGEDGLHVYSGTVYPFYQNLISNNGTSVSYRDGVQVTSSGTFYMLGPSYTEGYNEVSSNPDDQILTYGDTIV